MLGDLLNISHIHDAGGQHASGNQIFQPLSGKWIVLVIIIHPFLSSLSSRTRSRYTLAVSASASGRPSA